MSNMFQTITCIAAVCWGIEQPLTVEEIQVEPPQATEVRVKILCASLCHTDILYSQGFPAPLFPRVLGHEGVGVVESIGEKVTGIKEGDLVIPTNIGECKECENCTSGKSNLCLKYPLIFNGLMLDQTSRMSIKGQKLYQLISCSTRKLIFEKGSSVAVLGLGAVGIGAINGAKIQGATKIIGIDINEKKKEKGEAFGMIDFINSSESDKSISELVQELTSGMGVGMHWCCFSAYSSP
ncbi:putative Alcohol dehydrogenase [Quillaja saponaria]|uniref:Alcohol dehydrogenase n=1 Tax=Quillaja saponaria TaxID=32244 RepID=A0AAD7QJN4_QUISA|nr:putative Alcohol dehydrogenase [Quillaja saponaria]